MNENFWFCKFSADVPLIKYNLKQSGIVLMILSENTSNQRCLCVETTVIQFTKDYFISNVQQVLSNVFVTADNRFLLQIGVVQLLQRLYTQVKHSSIGVIRQSNIDAVPNLRFFSLREGLSFMGNILKCDVDREKDSLFFKKLIKQLKVDELAFHQKGSAFTKKFDKLMLNDPHLPMYHQLFWVLNNNAAKEIADKLPSGKLMHWMESMEHLLSNRKSYNPLETYQIINHRGAENHYDDYSMVMRRFYDTCRKGPTIWQMMFRFLNNRSIAILEIVCGYVVTGNARLKSYIRDVLCTDERFCNNQFSFKDLVVIAVHHMAMCANDLDRLPFDKMEFTVHHCQPFKVKESKPRVLARSNVRQL